MKESIVEEILTSIQLDIYVIQSHNQKCILTKEPDTGKIEEKLENNDHGQ